MLFFPQPIKVLCHQVIVKGKVYLLPSQMMLAGFCFFTFLHNHTADHLSPFLRTSFGHKQCLGHALCNITYCGLFMLETHLFSSAKIILRLLSLVSETKSSICADFRCFALNPIFLINLIIFIDVAEFVVLSTAYISLQLLDLSFQFQMSKTQSKLP